MRRLAEFTHQLEQLSTDHRRRRLIPRNGIDFASNDYLGLAGSEVLADAARAALARGVAIGSGGSRLLRGNHDEHLALEAEAAALYCSEAALFVATGYAGNAALLSTLPQRGDRIFHDALIHASAHEGMRLARCDSVAVAHNDAEGFDRAIASWRRAGGTGRPWIVVESLYSMDGDRAPLHALAAVAEAHDGWLVIDEAHATGVFGQRGRGLAADLQPLDHVVTLRTLGKALGCEGALICCSRVVADFLVNRARAFIFSTAPSPLMAAVARAAIAHVASRPEKAERLSALADHAAARLRRHGVIASGSQILPLILGDAARTMRVADALQSAGFDIRGIRPPTVPDGTSRLRLSITHNISTADIDALDLALERALA